MTDAEGKSAYRYDTMHITLTCRNIHVGMKDAVRVEGGSRENGMREGGSEGRTAT